MLGELGEGLFGGIGASLLSLSYSREAEAEADRVALALLDDTGIGAQGLSAFFKRLAEDGHGPARRVCNCSPPTPATKPARSLFDRATKAPKARP